MKDSSTSQNGRYLALRTLELVEGERWNAERALDFVCEGTARPARQTAYELSFGVSRWRSRLDDLLSRMLSRPLQKLHPTVHNIARLGLYQIRTLERVPVHAAVNETVALCPLAGVAWARGLVNGVLRRYLRERIELDALPEGHDIDALATRNAHPAWIVRAFQAVVPDDLEAWLRANNSVPPLVLRTNTCKVTRAELLERLALEGIAAVPTRYSPVGVVVSSRGCVPELPGYAGGLFAVQDEASQLVGMVCGAREGEHVLDACAAPGGKSLHLADCVGGTGRVFATDASRRRLRGLDREVARQAPGMVVTRPWIWGAVDPEGGRSNGGEGAALEGPGGEQAGWPDRFERALVDAPCSGLGVLRRIPEIKWRRREDMIPRYVERQRSILNAVADRVAPGGTLTYSICSPVLSEGPEVVRWFLRTRSDYKNVDLRAATVPELHPLVTDEGWLTTFPHRDGCDAFFVARLERVCSRTSGDTADAVR